MVVGHTLSRMSYSTLTVLVLCLLGGWRSEAACPGSDWKTYGEWCYLFQGENSDYTSWTDAEATCLQHKSTLISIHSEGENDFIVQEMLAEKPIRFNIGLKKINEGYEWADLSALDYFNWYEGQPNDGDGDYMCAQIHPTDSAAWILGRCGIDSAYVCKVGINSNPTPSPPERSCPSAEWDDVGESCFYYEVNGYQSWPIASDACNAKGGTLAVINDQSEMDRIYEKMREGSFYYSDYWIGLQVNGGVYDNWVDGTPVEYENFMDGEPNGQPGEYLCAMASFDTGEWDDNSCWQYGPYVCSTPKIVVGGWQEFNGKIYYHSHTYVQNSFTWYTARTFCNMEGGELASIHTQDEMDFIVNLMNLGGFSGNFWIGLNMIQKDTYAWTDGSVDTNYTNWDDTQPGDGLVQNDCVTAKMDTSGTWVETNCAKPSGFMCKKYPDSVYPIEPAPTPETAGFCPSGYIDMGNSNKCFKLVFEHVGVDWETAVSVCRQEPGLYPDIASITTAQEDAWITTQLQSYTPGLWIGLKLEDNNWVWADSADYVFQNWAPTQPAEEPDMCADVSYLPAGTWRKIKCDQKRGYICETYKDPNNYIPTRGVTPSHDCDKDGYLPNGEGCYKLVEELMSWEDAKTNCEKDGAYLVTMDSAAENAVAALFSEHASQVLWAGMYKDTDTGEWKWVNDWYVMYTNWETGYPREHDESNCMIIDSRAKWINVNCDVQFASLCKTTTATPITTPTYTDGTCPDDGGLWEAFGSHCYHFGVYMNWKSALTDCLRQSANLVSIHSDAENKFVTDAAYKYFGGDTFNTFIGFYKSTIDSSWRWQDGSAVQFTKWVDDRPPAEEDVHCTALSIHGSMQTYWSGGDCDTFGGYICKMPKSPPTTLPPTFNWVCPNNQWDELEETCFKYYPNSLKTWSNAAANCTAQGGHLATIETSTQNIHIYTMMEETSHMKGFDYWIGLSKTDKDSNYEWLDGSDLVYTAWAPGEPNDDQGIENCVQVMAADYLTTTWDDHDCEKVTNGFVCETSKVPKPVSGGLSAGAIVGIVFGVLIGVGLIGALVFALVYRSRNAPPPSGPYSQQGIDNPTMSTY